MHYLAKKARHLLIGSALVSFAISSNAASVDLSTQPLQVGFEPAPNIMFLIDNSGSMDWHVVISQGTDGFFEVTDDDGDVCDLVYTHPTHQNDNYRDPGDDTTLDGVPFYDYDNYYPVPPNEADPGKNFWRARNKDFNLLYYNPGQTYTPWSGEDEDGNSFVNATINAARVDPYDPDEGTFDLTSNTTYVSGTSNYTCQNADLTKEADTPWYPARYWQWSDTDNDGVVDGSDGHTLVEIKSAIAGGVDVYNSANDDRTTRTDCANAENNSCTYDEEIQNFANWFQYYRRRMLTAQAAYTQAINENENPGFIGLTTLNGHSPVVNTPVTDVTVPSNKTSLLGKLAQMRGSGDTPLRDHMFDTGRYLACDSNSRYSFASPSHIDDGSYCPALDANQGGSCQKNFMVVMTDGYYNGSFNNFPNSNNRNHDENDGPGNWDGHEYADTYVNTLADIAMYWFENDIHPDNTHPDIVNDVIVPYAPANPGDPNDPDDDTPEVAEVVANHQHIRTYTVAFGVEGTLPLDAASVAAREFATPLMPDNNAVINWPNPSNGDPEKIDDLLHAAFNGRGTFESARQPDKLKQALANILAEATQPSGSAATAGTVRSSIIAGGYIYQSIGNPNNWSGGLLARPISTGKPTVASGGNNHNSCVDENGTVLDVGEPCAPVWDAGQAILGQNWSTGREIITSHNDLGASSTGATRAGIAFRWDNLTNEQKLRLRDNSIQNGTDEDVIDGQNRLDYLRGRTDISGLRQRTSVLGDILDSGAIFVGEPPFGYDFDDYAQFKSDWADRDGIVYAGANDGMLHAFKALDGTDDLTPLNGEELFGYVPGDRILWANLNRYTHVGYRGSNHRYFVNGQPTYADVQVGGSPDGNGNLTGNPAWQSVLAGGLGNGGQLVYLLNITNPASFDEDTNAATTLKWEFSDLDDPDLGFTHSTPSIARMANGKWAVIIGNGYNNGDNDTAYGATSNSVSTSKQAYIFILYVDGPGGDGVWNHGTDYFKIPVGTSGTQNAMATPIAIDTNGDSRVDYIYAGDDLGRVWRFKVTSTNHSDWVNTGSNPPVKIFTAVNDAGDVQPISSRPEVVAHPKGVNQGVVVLFGTGRYLDETVDKEDDSYPVQTFYGIWDDLSANYSPTTRNATFDADLDNNGVDETYDVLAEQEILDEVQFLAEDSDVNNGTFGTTEDCDGTENCFRIITENRVNLVSGQNRGWYLDLYNTDLGQNTDNFGERVITNPLIRGSRVVFTTLLPKDDSAVCSSGGDGWLMELDFYTGGHPDEPVFDSTGNKTIDDKDRLKIELPNGNEIYVRPPGGMKFDQDKGLLPAPAIIIDPETNTEKKCFPRADGEMACVLEAGPSDGRLSWREIH